MKLLTLQDLSNELLYMICLNLDAETYHYLVNTGLGQILSKKDRIGLLHEIITIILRHPPSVLEDYNKCNIIMDISKSIKFTNILFKSSKHKQWYINSYS